MSPEKLDKQPREAIRTRKEYTRTHLVQYLVVGTQTRKGNLFPSSWRKVKVMADVKHDATKGDAPVPEDLDHGVNVGTSGPTVRLAFIRKVYSILTLQLLFTVGVSCLFMFVDRIRVYIAGHQWFIWIGLGVAIATLIPLFCFKRRHPLNIFLLAGFTIGVSFFIGTITAYYKEAGAGVIVLEAFVLTAGVFLSLTALCFIWKKDFSFLGGFLFAGFIILIMASVANFALGFVGARSEVFTWAISVGGALLFCGFILFDTSRIIKHLSPDDWVIGAVSLYTDVTNLFLYMLNILSLAQS